MKKVLKLLNAHFEETLCGALLISIMAMLFIQVVVRFVFGHGMTIPEELCRFFFLYYVYFTASLVALKGAHIRITAQMRILSPRAQLFFRALADGCWAAFNVTVIYQGVALLIDMQSKPMISGGLLLDMRYVYAAVPLAFILQTARILQLWVRHFKGENTLFAEGQEI